jgi:hypothetical protein
VFKKVMAPRAFRVRGVTHRSNFNLPRPPRENKFPHLMQRSPAPEEEADGALSFR